jgi:Zn-dependent peptidase ImmA (M78 family)
MSESYRQKLGISKFDPLDAFKLADHLQIPIYTVEEIFSDCLHDPAFSIMRDPAKFSAVWGFDEDGDKIIIHNIHHSAYRQQSNLMHEIAHILLNHQIPDAIRSMLLPFNLHYYNPLHEQEAKYLGGALQLTRPGLQWALKRSFSEKQISEYFSASAEMVKYRLNVTGVLRQAFYKNR